MHRSKRASPVDPQTLSPPGSLDLPGTSEISSGVSVREAHAKGGGELLFRSHLQPPPKEHSLIQGSRQPQPQVQSEVPRLHHPLSASTAQRNKTLFSTPSMHFRKSLPPRGSKPPLHPLAHTRRSLFPTHIHPSVPHLGSSFWKTPNSPQRSVSCGPSHMVTVM